GLGLIPATFAGLAIGRRLAGRLDGRWLRPAVNAFAGAAGVFALIRALL
ncbi:MAG: sulfite exporter TauE/SafE family protein, partial [Solirubrobacterales bacterium]|nr:sulfite exporter TauE/SafE family protein [Solirubrobacterales bacterium]